MDLEYRDDVFKIMADKLNGHVYVNLWVSSFMGNGYTLHTDYYTVLGGVVFMIGRDGKLYPSKDTLLGINTDCKRIRKYNPETNTLKSFNKEIEFRELYSFFKK